MKQSAVLIVALFGLLNLGAQDGNLVDGHLKKYEGASTDSARAYHLYWAAFHLAHGNAAEGIKWGRLGLKYAHESGNQKLIGDNHNSIGYCFDTSGNADSALVHYNLSIEALTAGGFACETAGVYSNIGSMKKRRNDLKGALESFLKSREIQSRCKDIGYHGSTLYSIGTCYNAMDNYEKALEYFRLSLDIERENKDMAKECIVRNGMANAYKGLGDFANAKAQFDFALDCYSANNNRYSSGYAYEGLAELHAAQNNLDSAVFYCTKAREIFLELKVNFDLVYETTLLAGYLKKQNKFSEAEKLLLEVLPISIAEKLHYDRQTILSELADIARKNRDFEKAYEYLFASTNLRDSLKIDEQKAELAELAGRYETEKRDKQIALQETEYQKQKQQKYFFLAGAMLFLLLALVLINRYLHKQRMASELASKNTIIEKEKERAERSEAVKQQFLANMSHEIRTPMNAITGLSRLLLDKKHDEQTREYLEAIQHSGENLLVILNDILDLSKMEAGKMRVESIAFDLRSELKNTARIFGARAEAKGISFVIHVDENIPQQIAGDPGRLAQVLNNLVSNAVKFTDQGSVALTVEAGTVNATNLPQTNGSAATVDFIIRDTGIGIPKENLELIFESFAQAHAGDTSKFGGTGLGLTIARNLIRLMGGELTVESVVNQGSVFSFSLPLIVAQQDGVSNSIETPSALSSRKIHVLVAEDNEYNFMVTRDTVQKYFPHANIIHVINGAEAVEALHEDDYDLVLMDIQMPVMDGYEATSEIRRINGEVKILGLTASVIRSDLDRCIAVGMNGYIAKPFRESDFVSAIAHELGDMGTTVPQEMEIPALQDEVFLQMTPKHIKALKEFLPANDFDGVKKLLHQIRPLLVRAGIATANEHSIAIENSPEMNDDVRKLISEVILELEQKLREISVKTTTAN